MNTTADMSPEVLRAQMVDLIEQKGEKLSPAVAEAMRTVPRHAFVPDASLQEAYGDESVAIKFDGNGTMVSCASAPLVVGMMLTQLAVKPGQRILEIGAGTGYNAALLAHLTGPNGEVTTVDYDPEITAHARVALDRTGNECVHVATGDGMLGDTDHAPYDRIIVTVGAWDIPQTWRDQLAPDGRLVVPLRWRGQTHAIALTHSADHLESDAIDPCGFVPMIGHPGELSATIDPGTHVTLYWDADQAIHPIELRDVLAKEKTVVNADVSISGQEPLTGIWIRLSAIEASTCRIAADSEAVSSGLCAPVIPSRSPAIVDGDSLAYLTLFRAEHRRPDYVGELGAIGHGPGGAALAERLADAVRAWARDRTRLPVIAVHLPVSHIAAEHAIPKPESTITITY